MEQPKTTTKTAATSATMREPRNFLATFLLVLGLGQFGANRIYTGHTASGYTRLILSVAGMLLSPVLIGIPMLLIAQIWGFIDIFAVYHGSRTDADGVKLYENTRDSKAAKILYIIFLVFVILAVLFIILMVTLVAAGVLNMDQSDVNRINTELNIQTN